MKRFIRMVQGLLFRGVTPKRRGAYRAYLCKGGPLNGEYLKLNTPGTLTFRLKGQLGRYVRSGRSETTIVWEGLKDD